VCFVWIWEQTAIISLYNINWLVCITETVCVYCAVRTGPTNCSTACFIAIQVNVASCNVSQPRGCGGSPSDCLPTFRGTVVVWCAALWHTVLSRNTNKHLQSACFLPAAPLTKQYNDCSLMFLSSSQRISQYSCRRSCCSVRTSSPPAALPVTCTGFPDSSHRLTVPIVRCV